MKTLTIMTLFVLAITAFYTFILYPNYKKCVEGGTDKMVCLHTWLLRF